MKDSILRVTCPCCRAVLEIDAATGVLLAHEVPKSKRVTKDLKRAVAEVKGEAAKREQQFQQAFEAERKREGQLEQRFEGLFKRQKDKPVERHLREIDLD